MQLTLKLKHDTQWHRTYKRRFIMRTIGMCQPYNLSLKNSNLGVDHMYMRLST